jgi:hypothetical protein
MKHFFTILIVVFFIKTTAVLAQNITTIPNSFIIHGENLQSSDVDFYTKSILAADMEQFRLQTETVVLKFKNGFDLELISAKDLVIKNIAQNVDITKYTNFPSLPNYKYPLFEVLKTGFITAEVKALSK